MPRSGRLRTFIQEFNESPRTQKLSFIPPFIILSLEIILLAHAIALEEKAVILLTSVLLIISIIEAILVTMELHEQYQKGNTDRILTIKLDDFILQKKEKNIKKIVSEFIEKYQDYKGQRNKIYHTACQILETHKEEKWEEELEKNLKTFINRRKKATVDDLLVEFIKKHPRYRKYKEEVYLNLCKLKSETPNNKN